jgi:hypothetical protein
MGTHHSILPMTTSVTVPLLFFLSLKKKVGKGCDDDMKLLSLKWL